MRTLWGLLLCSLVAVASCSSDASDGGTPGSSGGAPETATPIPPTTGYAASADAFAAFSGKNLAVTPLGSVNIEIGRDILGMKLELSPDKRALKVEIVSRSGTVAGPFALEPEPDFAGGFRGENLSAWGATGLTARVRVRQQPNEIDFLLGSPDSFKPRVATKALHPQAAVVPTDPPSARRAALATRWDELRTKQNLCNDLVRFATFVQDVLDSNQGNVDGVLHRDVLAGHVTGDLVDLFVPSSYSKEAIMLQPSFVAKNLPDPVPGCEDPVPFTGFGPVFRKGEGRFRHFSANAAMAVYHVGPLVNLAARLTGGDFEFLSDPTGDIAADLATNALGREFASFLKNDASLEAPTDVRDWIIRKFNAGASLTSLDVILDEPKGPFPAGAVIGLCRIRGCHVAQPDACNAQHVHDQGAGILIDEAGPYDQPLPPCGYGKTAVHPPPP